MIIIDQHAEQELTELLEAMRKDGQDARCIYISVRDNKLPQSELHQTIIASVRTHISTMNTRVYLCADGDVFILGSNLQGKEGRRVILDIVNYLGRPATDEWVIFVDLPDHVNKLLAALEPKLEQLRIEEEAKKKQAHLQLVERKRQSILNDEDIIHRDSIAERRGKRDHVEFMIIEDDVFSQRLVENVLTKQYKVIGLKEATHALDTYARVAPDLLFLDINLPDVTGHELLDRIITMDPNAYVIMLSGNADKENVTQALAKGAKGFVAKPFNRERLLHYVERCPTLQHHQ